MTMNTSDTPNPSENEGFGHHGIDVAGKGTGTEDPPSHLSEGRQQRKRVLVSTLANDHLIVGK